MRQQDLTRRSVLYGTAVIGAASLFARAHQTPKIGEAEGSLPWEPDGTTGSGKGGPAAPGIGREDSGAARLESVPATRLRDTVGATVSPGGMGTRNWIEAAHKFDAKVGRPLAATATRIYIQGSTVTGYRLNQVRMMAPTGVSAVISMRPSRSLRRSEIVNLQRSIRRIRAAGLKIEAVCLWHEPNDICKRPRAFDSAQQYVDYVRYYGPAVTEIGVPLAYIPLVLTTSGGLQDSFFPGTTWRGKPLVTHIYPDYYCVSQYVKGARMDASVQLADEHGLRLGLGEFGRTNCQHGASDAAFAAYVRYLRGIYAGRQNRASCIYFSDGQLNDPPPTGYTELSAFYDALTE